MSNKYINKIKKFFQFGNRTFKNYRLFIEKAKNNDFEFIPLMEFVKHRVPDEKLIGLRHDVDSELNHALKIAKIEHDAGVKATYFVRHTASYFHKNISSNKINDKLLKKLKYLQNTLGHEIGLHTDLMPIEFIYKKDPVLFVKELINLLKDNGINIVGIAPHGNLFHHIYRQKYIVKNKEIKNSIFVDPYIEFNKQMFNVSYEAYSLEHDKYFSDARFIDNKRWDFSCIEESFFKNNGRIIILTHTIHWASSKFYYFTINFILTIRYFLSYVNEYFKYKRSK